ncbi:DUF443 family protein [Enterococcus sp. AZ192]|uniref:DUF443 family protein n=1 Tax=unclassified Enterococcus TaxID=2608891 RepID=UPI003D2CA10B
MIVKTTNKRYRQLTYDGKKILLDMDSNKLTWLFPFLVWFLPIRGYIDKEIPILIENSKTRKPSGIIVLSSSILASVLIRMTNKGFGDLNRFSNPQWIAGITLFISMLIIISIRYFYRYKKNQVPILDKKTVLVRFKFSKSFKSKDTIKVFLVIVLCYVTMIYFIVIFLTSYLNITFIPVIGMIEYLILIVNTTILPPEKEELLFFEVI